MQVITFKTLPQLPPAILQRYASAVESGEGKIRLEARYCPAMDLIATFVIFDGGATMTDGTTADKDDDQGQLAYEDDDEPLTVNVWRFNGQQVFATVIEAEGYETTKVDIVDVSWRDDGKLMAVLSSDNVVRLVNSFSGKVAHKFSAVSSLPVSLSPESSVAALKSSRRSVSAGINGTPRQSSILAYSTFFASAASVVQQFEAVSAETGTELDDLLGLNADIGRLLKSKADLPQELSSIEVESFLPRLACLPPVGFGAEDLFSTRMSIDSIFHSAQKSSKHGTMDILLVGRKDANVHLRILDSFEIGDISLSMAVGLPKGTAIKEVLHIATHPFSDSAFIIAQAIHNKDPACVLVLELDLKFVSQSPTTLPVLARKSTQLENLLRYLKQIQNSLAREIKTAFELPGRFLRPLNEDLVAQDGDSASFTTVAYHALVTGQTGGVFREWLTDILGDRNVKRWEKSIEDCLELIRRLISEGWNPAVERSGVVTSRLTGLAGCSATVDGEYPTLGIDKRLVDEVQQTINVMAIRGEDLLREVSHELAGFNSFIKWLKWEVEAAGLEDTSERLDEMRESNDHSEVLKVLDYIDGGLVDSRLREYIGEINSRNFVHDESLNFYDHFKSERRRANSQVKLPTMGQLLLRMEEQCQKMFEQIALTLRQRVIVSPVAQLPQTTNARLFDAKVLCQPEFGNPQLHLLGPAEDGNGISHVVIDAADRASKGARPVLPVTRGTRPGLPLTRNISPDQQCTVLDAKFVDDGHLMLLAKVGAQVHIYEHSFLVSQDQRESWQLRHTFDQGMMGAGMVPARLAINGRKYRRAVAVIDVDGKGYSVYDLDSDEPQEGDAMVTG